MGILTKIIIIGGCAAALFAFIFRPSRKGGKLPPQPRETVQCPHCGAYRIADEPCHCGHS